MRWAALMGLVVHDTGTAHIACRTAGREAPGRHGRVRLGASVDSGLAMGPGTAQLGEQVTLPRYPKPSSAQAWT